MKLSWRLQLSNLLQIDHRSEVQLADLNNYPRQETYTKMMMPAQQELSAQQTAELLGISKHAVYRLAHAGKLQHYTIGKKMRFSTQDIEAYIQKQKEKKLSQKSPRIKPRIKEAPQDKSPCFIGGQSSFCSAVSDHLFSNQLQHQRCYFTSTESLQALYQGELQLAVFSHLKQSKLSNSSFIRTMLPRPGFIVFKLADINYGLLINDKDRLIKPSEYKLSKLLSSSFMLFNQKPGCEGRLLLDEILLNQEASSKHIPFYQQVYLDEQQASARVALKASSFCFCSEQQASIYPELRFIKLAQFEMLLAVDKYWNKSKLYAEIRAMFKDSVFIGKCKAIQPKLGKDFGLALYES